MTPKHDVDLKGIFSGPAYLSHIFYIIKNKNKIWEKESRENSSPDILYSWTFDFIKILKLASEYDNETKKIVLSNKGEELYEIVKNIDDNLLYNYGEVSESDINIYEKKLKDNIGENNLFILKTILYDSIINTKGYKIIKTILENIPNISKGDLYNKIAFDIGVSSGTLRNRVPSILQLANFLGLFDVKTGKYSISNNIILYNNKKPKKNIFITKKNENNLSSNVSSMEKLTSQEGLLLLSLLTKPFSILYGVSGTGKSRVVKELWKKMYGVNYINYFYKESVPPNWFDETEILGRYNKIENYVEGSFIKVLEKAIKDSKNQYVYLLDEMNLSHIEQYFAQYLSAVEDLNSSGGWINVGDTKNYSIKKYLEDKIQDEVIYDFNKPINLIRKYTFQKGKLDIDGTEIYSDSDFADFHKKIFKYIIDIYGENEDINIFDGTEIKTLTQKEEEGLIILNKENLDINNENGINFYVSKDTWGKGNTGNEFFYKGYAISTGYNLDERIKKVKKLVEFIGEKYLNNLELVFKSKEITNINNLSKDIIYYYKDNELIGKSLKLPKNLFVVGTINLDETTKSISPKVVDRANLIEFNDLDNFLFIEDNNKYDLDLFSLLDTNINFEDILEIREYVGNFNGKEEDFDNKYKINKEIEDSLKSIYIFLKIFRLHFSYRTLKEIIIFINIGKKLLDGKGIEHLDNKLYDVAILQKILPKLNGIIDYNFKLYGKKDNIDMHLFYDINNIYTNSYLLDFEKTIKLGFHNHNDNFKNSSMKLKRMQQFFDNYQNVNYFLS